MVKEIRSTSLGSSNQIKVLDFFSIKQTMNHLFTITILRVAPVHIIYIFTAFSQLLEACFTVFTQFFDDFLYLKKNI